MGRSSSLARAAEKNLASSLTCRIVSCLYAAVSKSRYPLRAKPQLGCPGCHLLRRDPFWGCMPASQGDSSPAHGF